MRSLAHDIEIAKAELTDIISEKDDSKKNGNAGDVRRLAHPKGSPTKERSRTVLLAKGRQNSTIRMMKGMTRTCMIATTRAKKCIRESRLAMVLSSQKEKKGIQSTDTLESTNSKHEYCMVAKRKNCDEAYSLFQGRGLLALPS
jgi:hypothetical protein